MASRSLSGVQEESPQQTFVEILDVPSGKVSHLAGMKGAFGPRWSPDGRYIVGISADSSTLLLWDFKTQQCREIAKSVVIGYIAWSADSRYVYFDTVLEPNPAYLRLSISDGSLENIIDLKQIRTFPSQFGPGSWTGLGPGDVPLFVRDTSTQEVYALNLSFRSHSHWLATQSVFARCKRVRLSSSTFVANVIEFYIPSSFHKTITWARPQNRGKLIEFRVYVKK
jgi:WD40 repeat protein